MVGSATKVTVFGGTGFLGRYVVRQLAAEGKVVTVAVRHPEEGLYLKTAGNVGQVVLRRTDLLHPGSVAAALAGADEVVNLVGILYETGRYGFDAVQRDGAAHVAEAAARANVRRLVHVSAIGADLRSPAAYARSKAGGERAIREAFPEATILRPSILVGPEDDFFNRFALMAQFLPALPLIGGGHTKFQPVYVGDVADAVSAALADPAARGRIYELGGPNTYTFTELMRLVLRWTRRRRFLVPVPYRLARIMAFFAEFLPVPPLTRDQVELLKSDNVASPGSPGLKELGLTANAIEGFVPAYLARYRRGGGNAERLGRAAD
ncbi:MAG: complex I NDUFA9 subunit family protein [Alphaproteobacteria bacterium]